METGPEVFNELAWMHTLIRMQIVFYLIYRLVDANIIAFPYISTCSCCGESVREDLKHIFSYAQDLAARDL